MDEKIIIPVDADLTGFTTAMSSLEKQSKQFGSVFTSTIRTAVVSGKSFDETLKGLALRLSNLALNAGLKPLENLFSGLFEGVVGGLSSSFGNTNSPAVTPFAKGGVVSSPTFFGRRRRRSAGCEN